MCSARYLNYSEPFVKLVCIGATSFSHSTKVEFADEKVIFIYGKRVAFSINGFRDPIHKIWIILGTEMAATGLRCVVLDIDHEERKQRLAQRNNRGTLDYFDRYMRKDPLRSERIEEFLVWISRTYQGAVRVENNNLSDAALLAAMG